MILIRQWGELFVIRLQDVPLLSFTRKHRHRAAGFGILGPRGLLCVALLLLIDGCSSVPLSQLPPSQQLIAVTQQNDTDAALSLIKTGTDVHVRGQYGVTPLMNAAYHGNLAVVKALLAAGAGVNARSYRNGVTPLINAAGKGHTAVVEALLTAGADVDAKAKNGTTALDNARLGSHSDTVQLLEAGVPTSKPRVLLYVPRDMQARQRVWEFNYLRESLTLTVAIGPLFVHTLTETLMTQFPTLEVTHDYPSAGPYDLLLKPDLTAELQGQLQDKENKANITLDVTTQLACNDAEGKQLAALSGNGTAVGSINLLPGGVAAVTGVLGVVGNEKGSMGQIAFRLLTNKRLGEMGMTSGFQALTQAVDQMAAELTESAPVQAYVARISKQKQLQAEQRARPSALVTSVQFEDDRSLLPNNRLDAGETSELVVTVENQGAGSGYGVVLTVSADQPHVTLPGPHELGEIPPGQNREIRLPVTAGLNLPSGEAPLRIEVREKRGYHARPVKLVLPTAQLEKSSLAIVAHEINDGTTGQAQGNGNGVPENGETIELLVFIRNDGPGAAANALLSVASVSPGIDVVRREAGLGTIAPHQTARGTVAFAIPRTHGRDALTITLQAHDARGEGAGNAVRQVAFNVTGRMPALAATTRILHRGEEVRELTNDQTVEIEVTPRNTGNLDAMHVAMQVHTDQPGVVLSKDRVEIGTLKAGTVGQPRRFALTIPRGFLSKRLLLTVEMRQQDFSPQEARLELPVQVRRPILASTFTVVSRYGGQAIEQNETADLDVRIVNTGNLPAHDVQAQLASSTPGVEIRGQQTVRVGTVLSQAQGLVRFRLRVQKSVQPGELPLTLTLKQADFPARDSTLRLEVRSEQAVVQRVVSARPPLPPVSRPQPPIIALASPTEGRFVRDDHVDLVGTVVDTQGIERVTVVVNGKPVPQETIFQGLNRQPARSGLTRDRTNLSVSVPLDQGRNLITITAYNTANEREQVSLSVTRLEAEPRPGKAAPSLVPHADVDQYILGQKATRADPSRWAVIIGIEQYRKAPSVDFAIRDAYAIREYAVKLLGVPSDQVFLLLDDQATKSEMQVLLEDRLRRRIPPGSTIFIYFAGHGIPDVQNGIPYLLPADGDPQSLRFSAYAVRSLYGALGKLKADRVAVFLDTCFSGLSARQDKPQSLFPGARPATLVVRDPVLASPNLVSLAAARNDQVSNAYPAQAHGLFTYFLLKGLSGAADTDRDRTVRLAELARYLQAQVDHTTRRLFGQSRAQTPVIQPETVSIRDFVLRMQEK